MPVLIFTVNGNKRKQARRLTYSDRHSKLFASGYVPILRRLVTGL